jgi:hypothetical protein
MIKERLNKLDKFFRNIRDHKSNPISLSISSIHTFGYIPIGLLIKTNLGHPEASEAYVFHVVIELINFCY